VRRKHFGYSARPGRTVMIRFIRMRNIWTRKAPSSLAMLLRHWRLPDVPRFVIWRRDPRSAMLFLTLTIPFWRYSFRTNLRQSSQRLSWNRWPCCGIEPHPRQTHPSARQTFAHVFSSLRSEWSVLTTCESIAQLVFVRSIVDGPSIRPQAGSMSACRDFSPTTPDCGRQPAVRRTCRYGIGRPEKRRARAVANKRTQRPERATRALSVGIPVQAYIWRYILR